MGSMKKLFLLGSAFLLTSGAVNAIASPCDSVLSSYSWFTSVGDLHDAGELVSAHPECFGGSPTTSQVQINSTSVQHASAISFALASRTMGSSPMESQANLETKSMASGGKSPSLNVWASGTINDTNQSYTALDASTTKNDTDIRTAAFGADYALTSLMAVGLSASFDNGDGLGSNGGGAPNRFTSKGYLIAPYFGMQISNELAVDVSLGLGKGELDIAGNVTTEADRLFAATNLSYSKWLGNAQLTGKIGYLHAEEKYDNTQVGGVDQSGTGAKNKLDQLRGGLQAGYWMDGVMPYLGLSYSDDVHRSTTQAGDITDPIGEDGWLWTVGVNFVSTKSGLTAGLAYSQEEGRSNQDNEIMMANINYRF